MAMNRLSLALLLLPLTNVVAAQRSWRVPGDAPYINDAVRAASPGDSILLVATTPYGQGNDSTGLVVDKALTIEPLSGRRATFTMGEFAMVGISVSLPGGRFVMRNVDLVPDNSNALSHVGQRIAVRVTAASASANGRVVLDSVAVEGILSNADNPCPALVLVLPRGVDAFLRDCTFRGATGDPIWISQGEVGWLGSVGAQLSVAGDCIAQDCTFVGGDGGYAWWGEYSHFRAKDGGPGLTATGDIALVGGMVVDGNGGSVGDRSHMGTAHPCNFVGSAGVTTWPTALFDIVHQAGAFGSARTCTHSPPSPRTLGRDARDLRTLGQWRTGTPIAIDVRSQLVGQGISVLAFGLTATTTFQPWPRGNLIVDSIFLILPVPPRTGSTWVQVVLPPIPALFDSLDVVLQPVHFVTASNGLFPGAPGTATIFP